MPIFTILLGLVDPVTRVINAIAKAREAETNAQTEQERIAAQERVKALEAQRDVLVAEGGSKINALVRAGFALPFMVYNGKLVLWDKVLGLGTTDPLSAELFQIEMVCIGFYFLHAIADRLKR